MIYVVLFGLVIALAAVLDKVLSSTSIPKKKKVLISIILCSFIVALPVAVAGLRSPEVGTDTSFYALGDFKESMKTDNYFEVVEKSNDEPGFVLIAFLSAKIFGNFNIFLAIIELIIIVFILKFAIDRRTQAPIYITIGLYMLLCFGESLSIMRQNMALAIMLYSLKYIDNRKYYLLLLFWLLAFEFHQTAIFFGVFYVFYWVARTKRISSVSKRIKVLVGLTVVILALVLCIEPITRLLAGFGIVSERLLTYFNAGSSEGIKIGFNLCYRLVWLLLFGYLLFKVKDNENKSMTVCGLCILVIDFALFILSSRFAPLMRMSMYLSYPVILTNGTLMKYVWTNKIKGRATTRRKEILITIAAYAVLVFAFWYNIIYQDYNNTYPYKTIITNRDNYGLVDMRSVLNG